MNIKKEYIDKTRKYLNDLFDSFKSIPLLESHIKDLKEMEKFNEMNYDIIFSGNNVSYKGIDDLIINLKNKIFNEEGKIDHINKKYEKIELFLKNYKDSERKVIEYKYFSRKKDNSPYTNTEIANKLNYSVSSVKRIDRKIIIKLAVYLYKKEAIEEEEEVA